MAEAREKPCVNCRRRKVRCNKSQPCSNCVRLQARCLYDDNLESDRPLPLVLDKATTIHLFERLSGLEKTVASLVDLSNHSSTQGLPVPGTRDGQQSLLMESDLVPVSPRNFPDRFFPLHSPQNTLANGHSPEFPSLHESDALIKLFLDLTEPFIRMLHTQMFHKHLQAYRDGDPPLYFETLLPSIYALGIATLSSSFILDFFKRSRDELLVSLRADVETALLKADFMRTHQPVVLRAVLYYIIFLFETGDHGYASTLLGVAIRIALTIGIHKNQTDVSSFVGDLRRRLWLQIKNLDRRARELLSIDSSLRLDWDANGPKHASDENWERFLCLSETFKGEPESVAGFADTSYIIAHEEIAALNDQIRVAGLTYDHVEAFISHRQQQIWAQYLNEGCNQTTQGFVKAFLNIRLAAVHLTARQAHHREANDNFRGETFIKAIELLEAISALEADAEYFQYLWVLRSFVPVEAVVTVLVAMSTCARLHSSPDCQDRAWVQIEAVYARYDNVDCRLIKSVVFEPINALKDQARKMSAPRGTQRAA